MRQELHRQRLSVKENKHDFKVSWGKKISGIYISSTRTLKITVT